MTEVSPAQFHASVPRVRRFRLTAGIIPVAAAVTALLSISTVPVEAQDLAAQFSATGSATLVHDDWTQLLQTYVKPATSGLNRVDYDGFKKSGRAALNAYLTKLESTDVSQLARNEQFAFWTNLYNAKTIDIILEHYPVKTIRDIDISPGLFSNGPWGKKVVTVNGVELSLDDIEHKIMRPNFKDPRIHYAVNCASVGCPNLAIAAYSGAELESQLNDAAKNYVNSPRGFAVSGGRLKASKIYKWYRKDFGDSEAGVLKHALKYAEPDLAARIKAINDIRGYDYDWELNDTNK